jgi:hypothetical protein
VRRVRVRVCIRMTYWPHGPEPARLSLRMNERVMQTWANTHCPCDQSEGRNGRAAAVPDKVRVRLDGRVHPRRKVVQLLVVAVPAREHSGASLRSARLDALGASVPVAVSAQRSGSALQLSKSWKGGRGRREGKGRGAKASGGPGSPRPRLPGAGGRGRTAARASLSWHQDRAGSAPVLAGTLRTCHNHARVVQSTSHTHANKHVSSARGLPLGQDGSAADAVPRHALRKRTTANQRWLSRAHPQVLCVCAYSRCVCCMRQRRAASAATTE